MVQAGRRALECGTVAEQVAPSLIPVLPYSSLHLLPLTAALCCSPTAHGAPSACGVRKQTQRGAAQTYKTAQVYFQHNSLHINYPFSQTEYLTRFLTLYKCSSVVNELRAASHLNYRSNPLACRTQERDAGSKGRRQQGSAPPRAVPQALRWAAHP